MKKMAVTVVTEDNFKQEVLESNKHVLVDFWAEWCGPCKLLTPVIEKLSEKMDEKFKFCKLNVDEHAAIAQQFEITGIPCCIVFNNGSEVSRIIGYKTEENFEELLNEIK